jgi:hypothetical protein
MPAGKGGAIFGPDPRIAVIVVLVGLDLAFPLRQAAR